SKDCRREYGWQPASCDQGHLLISSNLRHFRISRPGRLLRLYSLALPMKTTWFTFILAFVAFWLEGRVAGQDAQPSSRFIYVEPHMGTRFKIVLYAKNRLAADQAAQAAFKRIAALDAMMSDYRPDSELMRLCRNAVNKPVHVSNELFFVIARAQDVSRASGGA